MQASILPFVQPPSDYRQSLRNVQESLSQLLKGKEKVIEFSMTAVIAGGHILLEGPPGTGKTSLARGLAHAFGDSYHRIQMTSDLLPSDIVGFLRLRPGTSEFEFRKGPIFTHFLLADELNRSNPKTQSALLEAMAESTVSVDGITHHLPSPFFVVATQNPLESHGVYPLAESQLDRFMFQLAFDFPNVEDELKIYQNHTEEALTQFKSDLTVDHILTLRREANKTHVEATVIEYINELIRTSRSLPGTAYGVSIRGGLQFVNAAKTLAYIRGRNFVTPLDIQDLAIPTIAHRLCFRDGNDDTSRKIEAVTQLIKSVRAPK